MSTVRMLRVLHEAYEAAGSPDLDVLLCHCRVQPDGHAPGDVLDCEAGPVARGAWPRPADERGGIGYAVRERGAGRVDFKATGTCRACGSTVKVRRAKITGTIPSLAKDRPHLLGHAPVIAPHKAARQPCTGAGLAPVETRFVPSREVASWAVVHGPDSVDLDGVQLALPAREAAAS